jgi:hypothetical protein
VLDAWSAGNGKAFAAPFSDDALFIGILRELKLHNHRRCPESVRSASEFESRPASSEEEMRAAIAPMLEAAMPSLAHRNTRACRTDVVT